MSVYYEQIIIQNKVSYIDLADQIHMSKIIFIYARQTQGGGEVCFLSKITQFCCKLCVLVPKANRGIVVSCSNLEPTDCKKYRSHGTDDVVWL